MIKKDKIYELKIDDEDEISGIDSISLVDEPAIEVNWMFFNKTKEHNFEEDTVYTQHLMSVGESEEDLFADGWVVDSVEYLDGKEEFVNTDPNASSSGDEKEYKVRYKYILNPKISGQPAIIDTSRPFCRELIRENKVFRIEDIDAAINDFGQSPRTYRGSWNCRHIWSRIKYRNDATIINKASVNRGKVEVDGFPNDILPDPLSGQPDTVTDVTKRAVSKGTAAPTTVRNLGLSKDKFEIDDQNVNVFGYHTIYFALCPSAQELFRHLVTMQMDEDTIGMVRSAARAADNVFRIELDVIKSGVATQHQYEEAIISVDDIEDIMEEVDERIGMEHDVSFMYGHIEKIKEYLKDDFAKISIDYDDTLSTQRGKDLARRLINEGNDLYIVTRRYKYESNDVYRIAKEIGIPQSKIYFTEGRLKWRKLKELGIQRHIDNNPDEIKAIKENAPLIRADKFEYDVSTIGGYKDPGIKKKKKKEQMESYSDYPDSVKNNAKAVLKWVDENGWGSCGTDVGKQRANQLANGEAISEETIRRMYSYLSRHKVDLESSKGYDDGCGKLMYDSWGGLSALSWSESKINAIDREKMSIQKFARDEEKRIVIGPAMIPDLKIFRKDKDGNPYHVYFSAETIKMIAEKYMRNKYIDNNDENHDGKAVKDVYVIESWIKEDEQDKSNKYGYEDLPIGTWFVSMKVRNDDVWQRVKAGELNGFSVSGYFEEVAEFCREEMFLKQVAEILKKY